MDCVSHLFCSQRIPPSHHYVGYGPLLSFTQHGATSGHTPLPALVISLSSSPQQKKLIIARGSPLSQFTDCVLSAIIRCIVFVTPPVNRTHLLLVVFAWPIPVGKPFNKRQQRRSWSDPAGRDSTAPNPILAAGRSWQLYVTHAVWSI